MSIRKTKNTDLMSTGTAILKVPEANKSFSFAGCSDVKMKTKNVVHSKFIKQNSEKLR